MAADKKTFLKNVCILIDTREQKNEHITKRLDELGIQYESRKLDYGDYSFTVTGHDFSMSCVVERKANVDELYGNIMHDRGRIEKELYAGSRLAKQLTIIIEKCEGWDALKAYTLPKYKQYEGRKVYDIGKYVYATLKAWKSGNRYAFDVEFSDGRNTVDKMLEVFYYYWHSYHELTAARR